MLAPNELVGEISSRMWRPYKRAQRRQPKADNGGSSKAAFRLREILEHQPPHRKYSEHCNSLGLVVFGSAEAPLDQHQCAQVPPVPRTRLL